MCASTFTIFCFPVSASIVYSSFHSRFLTYPIAEIRGSPARGIEGPPPSSTSVVDRSESRSRERARSRSRAKRESRPIASYNLSFRWPFGKNVQCVVPLLFARIFVFIISSLSNESRMTPRPNPQRFPPELLSKIGDFLTYTCVIFIDTFFKFLPEVPDFRICIVENKFKHKKEIFTSNI